MLLQEQQPVLMQGKGAWLSQEHGATQDSLSTTSKPTTYARGDMLVRPWSQWPSYSSFAVSLEAPTCVVWGQGVRRRRQVEAGSEQGATGLLVCVYNMLSVVMRRWCFTCAVRLEMLAA